MSHKKTQWNFTKNKINKIAYDNVLEILQDKEKIDINELISSLNIRTRNLIFKKNTNKSTNITTYLSIEFGSFTKFIDNYDKFGLCNQNNKLFIILNDNKRNEYNDWIIVNNEF